MRNLYLSLLILISSCNFYEAQTSIYAAAPVPTGTTNSYAPTGYFSSEFMRNCFLFKGSELSTFTSSLITAMGFSLSSGASIPVNGNVQIYMQNTSDVNYLKGTSYANIISPMTLVYSGSMLIPSTTNTASTMMTLNTPFNYTGGGIYVALSWTATAPFASTSASYHRDLSTNGTMGAYKASTTNNSVLNTLQTTAVRPVYIFNGVNTSSNEASITGIIAPGIVGEAMNAPHLITARISNNSNATLTNKQVFLNVTGVNPFTDTQTIPSIAAGGTANVVFAAYTPTVLGLSTINISLPADDINSNNGMSWDQGVNCNSAGYFPLLANFGSQLGYSNVGRIYSCRYNFPTTTTLTHINIPFPNGPVGYYLNGTLQDASGVIIATTNTAQSVSSSETYTFATPQVLNANTDYYIGLAQPLPGLTAITVFYPDYAFVPGRYFVSPPSGGSVGMVNNYYFAIEAVFAGPEISISPASAIICAGEPIVLTAGGTGVTYTWSSAADPIGNPHTAQITVSPTVSAAYMISAKDAAGCAGVASAIVDVDECVGIDKDLAKQTALKLYPNPAQDGQAYVDGLSGENTISVFNLLGEIILEKRSDEQRLLIDLREQASGSYLVRVATSNAGITTFKLINP
ncbi:MAG TPA: T9SS type A sorting domain-containing protein [Bacteroidia bacterium]|nr:T9SS type A sorting domain-containing protein [Bacteroidia bacterium]